MPLTAMPDSDHKQALPPDHQLGRYRLLGVLGVGGFGVTYLGEHISLGHRVAVKEYLPNEFAVREGATVHPKSSADREDFEWGLTRFVDEARTLTRFRHPNLVRVSDYFEANNTAYIVMDYEDGEPLDVLLERHGTLTEAQLKRVLLPVVDGLRQVHAAGFLHRDIKPSNLFVRRSDETPVLLDFGTARQALGRKSKSMTAIASAGYSPPEQYESQGAQGAWTDIYALSALCYRAITGKAPMEALRRQSQLLRSQVDPLPRLAETAVPAYSQAFLKAVDGGLRVIETERPQSLDEWLARMEPVEAPDPPKVPKTSARSKRGKTVGPKPPKPPKPTGRDARRRTGTSTPPETSARSAARRREGFGARAVWLGSAAVAIAVTLYFALDPWPQGSGQGTISESAPPVAQRFRDCANCPEMVVVPSGSFMMGSPSHERGRSEREGPVHLVTIAVPFAVGVYEVTFAEWDACVAAGGCGGYRPDDEGWGRGRRPVVNVSWDNAQSYVEWLSGRTGHRYRLLSESEWEYAARAGTTGPFHTGSTISTDQANYDGRFVYEPGREGVFRVQTLPVGSFPANGFGLHDVHGNVSEWVQDCLNRSYTGAPSDGSAWESGNCSFRVLRSGSWSGIPRGLRSANRGWNNLAGYRYYYYGFRVARTLTP